MGVSDDQPNVAAMTVAPPTPPPPETSEVGAGKRKLSAVDEAKRRRSLKHETKKLSKAQATVHDRVRNDLYQVREKKAAMLKKLRAMANVNGAINGMRANLILDDDEEEEDETLLMKLAEMHTS